MHQPRTQSADTLQPVHVESEQPTEAQLRLRCSWLDGSLIIAVDSLRVDAVVAPDLSDYLAKVDLAAAERIIFDLGRVEALDSSALAVILRACRQVAASVEVRLVASSERVSRLLRLTEVDRLMPVYSSLASALRGREPNHSELHEVTSTDRADRRDAHGR
jgi:anti-sigma B factor antagonist